MLHSWKVNAPQGTNSRTKVSLFKKATLAFFLFMPLQLLWKKKVSADSCTRVHVFSRPNPVFLWDPTHPSLGSQLSGPECPVLQEWILKPHPLKISSHGSWRTLRETFLNFLKIKDTTKVLAVALIITVTTNTKRGWAFAYQPVKNSQELSQLYSQYNCCVLDGDTVISAIDMCIQNHGVVISPFWLSTWGVIFVVSYLVDGRMVLILGLRFGKRGFQWACDTSLVHMWENPWGGWNAGPFKRYNDQIAFLHNQVLLMGLKRVVALRLKMEITLFIKLHHIFDVSSLYQYQHYSRTTPQGTHHPTLDVWGETFQNRLKHAPFVTRLDGHQGITRASSWSGTLRRKSYHTSGLNCSLHNHGIINKVWHFRVNIVVQTLHPTNT